MMIPLRLLLQHYQGFRKFWRRLSE